MCKCIRRLEEEVFYIATAIIKVYFVLNYVQRVTIEPKVQMT